MSSITIESVFITAAVIFTLVFILNIVLLWDLRRQRHQICDRQIEISSQLCLLSSASLSFLFVAFNLIKYVSLTPSNTNPFAMKSFANLVLFFRVISGVLNFIFVGYFITIKLEHAFKDTFLSVKKRTIYIFFWIWLITMCINWWGCFYLVFVFSHWYPHLAGEPYQTLLAFTNGAYSFTSEMYFILILVIFNWKLFKFVRLTQQNDQVLSLEINNRFKNFVIKQTNLISVIIIAFCIFQAIAYWKWVESPKDNLVNLLYPILFTIQQSLWTVCIYLTFKFNNRLYYGCCKYSHLCCIYSCEQCTNWTADSVQKESIVQMVERQISLAVSPKSKSTTAATEIVYEFCAIDHCPSFQLVFDALNRHMMANEHVAGSANPTEFDDKLFEDLKTSELLNAFEHLLKAHDSDLDFAAIYDKLHAEMNGNMCEYTQCQIYSRHYLRRARHVNHVQVRVRPTGSSNDDNGAGGVDDHEVRYCLQNILDKIHSFYYHSYDTFARIRESEHSFHDQDDRLSSIHRMVQSRRERGDRPETLPMANNNKFNSDLKILQENQTENDIYSFGERFEYDEEKNDMFVTPRYGSMKDEFINNHICRIELEIYQIEYDKCTQYMCADICKQHDFPIHGLLALMVYCNCDKYQAKWSETFRQIPCNESKESLIRRHSHFYHCSKNLRDLIEYHGSALIESDHENKVFFHGVNQVLYLTRTITKFNAPLSTSTEATIALNFSGEVGVVLELKYSSATYLLHAKYFDCAFFSDYVNEKECLFLGGIPMMIITNIINVGNGHIYRKYINALNIINCVLNGTLETDNTYNYCFDAAAVQLCASLLSYQLSKNEQLQPTEKEKQAFPDYVATLLHRYCSNLSNIMVFWQHTQKVEALRKLLCNQVNDELFFDLDKIMRLFPHLESIEYRFEKNHQLLPSIKQLMNHVGDLSAVHQLKYVVIHHKTVVPHYDKNGWKSFQDSKRIYLYRGEPDDMQTTLKHLHFKYDQIKQSIASKSMIRNVL